MTDNNAILQASVTKTSTFNGAALDTGEGTPRRGIPVRVIYSAATNASGSNSVTFTVDVSADNSTWYTRVEFNPIALSTTAQSGELNATIETESRYIRLSAVFAGAGSTPTITYQGDLTMSKP